MHPAATSVAAVVLMKAVAETVAGVGGWSGCLGGGGGSGRGGG